VGSLIFDLLPANFFVGFPRILSNPEYKSDDAHKQHEKYLAQRPEHPDDKRQDPPEVEEHY
jgi:hypothetical protein